MQRLLSRLAVLAAIAILAGVTFFFFRELRSLDHRRRVVQDIRGLADEEGPCVGLLESRRLAEGADADLEYTLNGVRAGLARDIIGSEDGHGRSALLAADKDGILDLGLCEQIRLARAIGEVHPVFALLRFVREGGHVCEDTEGLGKTLEGLGSHRAVMLHALMADVGALDCLGPGLREKIAGMVAETVASSPRFLDDLDVLRIASFLDEWAPLPAAQLGCRIEARGDVSRLGALIGCTPDHKRRVLPRYKTLRPVPDEAGGAGLAQGAEVLLLREEEPLCDVLPVTEGARLVQAPCKDLVLVSGLKVAVRVEAVSYGRVQADLIAGVATYEGESGRLSSTTQDPGLRSWFAYDRRGEALGSASVVELTAVAALFGEQVPERPLKAFCERSGARYCYDVDWAQAVTRLPGEAVVFLSRPARVFLPELELGPDEAAEHFAQAFGRPPATGSQVRLHGLEGGGELITEGTLEGIELRLRVGSGGPWLSQRFGTGEGGPTPPSARLLAALDVQRDGRPELVVQRVAREAAEAGLRDVLDEVLLLHLPAGAGQFATLNRLTVHEY